MIVGDGDIGTVLHEVDRPDILYFASGVSNSKEKREAEYKREMDLLLKQRRDLHLVYFSSLSVFYADTRYARHKLAMELLVQREFHPCTIVRLGNIAWGDNPNTLINYIRNNRNAEIQDVYRFVIDKDEFLDWLRMIPKWSCEMNLPGRRLKVIDILKEIEEGKL